MSTDISSKFIKAFWCYLFLEKGNKINQSVHNQRFTVHFGGLLNTEHV